MIIRLFLERKKYTLFYKYTLYKNIQDELGQKTKNILRILSS